jgi:hypothetical protein
MPSYTPAKKNDPNGLILYVSLVDQSNTKLFKANPTLASGDCKISLDGGAFANLATLPTVTPAAGRAVKITLSQAETNADNLLIVFSDAAGAEWCDLAVNIQTSARQIDDLATPTNITAAAGITLAANAITTASIADDAITDAKIAVPAETAGRPTRILAMIRRVFEKMANKINRDRSTGAVTVRNAADSADLETQTQSTATGPPIVDTISKGV